MTARTFQEDILAAAEAGMQAHISKPIDADVMPQIIMEVLHDRSSACN